ncbi:MAG: tetratricopeptide repeat protein, partial [Muribaculaceae bacterium]|nr:tetratricopeptide repeat protein [Muribaculaceae bacterium]
LNAARAGIMRAARDLGNYEALAAAAAALLASSTIGSEDKNEAIFSKALALSETGNAGEARQLWESISPMTDDLYGAKSALYLAQSYFDTGMTDKAKTAVEALTGSGTPHSYWLAKGFILLSDIYASEGKTFEAREYLNALRENYPGNEADIFMMIDSRLSSLE